MKHLLLAPLFSVVLSLGGCFTNAVITEAKGYKSKSFYPDAIGWTQSKAALVIIGTRSTDKGSHRCHVIVPEAMLLKLKNQSGEVRLSDLSKLSREDVQRLRLVDGPPPTEFVELATNPSAKVVLDQGYKVFRPGPLLLLPVALVFDVVTLPVAIPLAKSFSAVH